MYLTKKSTFFFSIVLSLFLLLTMEELGMCQRLAFIDGSKCLIPANDNFEFTLLILVLAVTPLSLIVLPFCDHVFEAWKKFFIWGVPVVVVLTYLITTYEQSTSGGFMNIEVAPMIVGFIYAIYLTVSLVIITIAWSRCRRNMKLSSETK